MAEENDRIFVSIGVSKPDGDLEALPGAISAAKRMAAWAKAHDYLTVCLVDDEQAEITVELLREQIAGAIEQVTNHSALKRIVVFFAGHGAAQAVGDQYWMLSNWYKRPTEAVKVAALQRMLAYYGPQQVAIISDACQEYSARFLDVTGSPVLERTDEEPTDYEIDQFFAVDVGKQAFMIKATRSNEAFCIFTEVLLDVLEGDVPQALFETIDSKLAITSQSVAKHLKDAVAREAGKHGVRMIPRQIPGFYTDRVYVSMSDVPTTGSAAIAPHDSTDRMVGAQRDGDGLSPPPKRRRQSARRRQPSPKRSVKKARLKKPATDLPDLKALEESLQTERLTRQARFTNDVLDADVRASFESGAGVCVSGATVQRLDVSLGAAEPLAENVNWFRLHLDDQSSLGFSDTLVTLSDGRIFSVCAVQNFVAALHLVDDGKSVSLFHRPIGASDFEDFSAVDMLGSLHAGTISADRIIDMAAMLRHGKHRVITMGCIAAQFYDAIRDVDSLRQMASYYAQHNQPVPFDIVLYGGAVITESNGKLYANIPAVPARQPRTLAEEHRRFTTAPTPGFDLHPIAGRVPWMRQAWSAVETALCDASAEAWRADAMAAMKHLGSAAFTVFTPDGLEAAAKLARIQLQPASARDDAVLTT